jgi:uncharacterized protein YjbJ (UPF0337 family)
MNKDEIQGKVRNLKGRLKESAGAISGNRRLQDEGAAERLGGTVEAGLGKAGRKVGEALEALGAAVKKGHRGAQTP